MPSPPASFKMALAPNGATLAGANGSSWHLDNTEYRTKGTMQTPAPDQRPQTYASLIRKAGDLRKAGDFAAAAAAYLEAASAITPNHEALLFHAISLKEAGQQQRAIEAYQAMLAQHPGYATGWSLYGTYQKNLGNHAEAIAALRKSLELHSDIDTRNALVIALYQAGRTTEARLEGLRNLIEKDQDAQRRFAEKSSPPTLDLRRVPRAWDPQARRRNVIAFSLWGDNPVYVHGAIENARLAQHIYYGWTARFYCDASVPEDAREELQRAGAEVILMSDPALQTIKPMWRFFSSDDPEVDWFICRDADSRLNAQELIAVEAWLRSGKPFHIMRDHLYHMELILAGMWGGAGGVLPSIRAQLLAMPEYFNNRFADQAYLKNEVWPLVRDHSLTHDSYYHYHNGKDFPDAYRLPGPIHVGGSIKAMRHWRDSGH